MFGNRRLGAVLIILGVLGNNYFYLHDIIWNQAEIEAGFAIAPEGIVGVIVLGWVAAILIIATLAVTAVGLMIVMRPQAPTATE